VTNQNETDTLKKKELKKTGISFFFFCFENFKSFFGVIRKDTSWSHFLEHLSLNNKRKKTDSQKEDYFPAKILLSITLSHVSISEVC